MTETLPPRDPNQRFNSIEDLETLFNALLESAVRSQLWVFMFDAEQRLVDPIIPFEDLPSGPDELCETDDMGSVQFATMLLERIAWIAEVVEAESWVGVWERPGRERFEQSDLDWARAMANGAGPITGVPRVRAQFVLHDTGLRLITPDDYL